VGAGPAPGDVGGPGRLYEMLKKHPQKINEMIFRVFSAPLRELMATCKIGALMLRSENKR
jgi:hypothetical protein